MKDLWILPTICKMLTVHTSSVESGRCQKLNAADVKAAVVAQCGRCCMKADDRWPMRWKVFESLFKGRDRTFRYPSNKNDFQKNQRPKPRQKMKNDTSVQLSKYQSIQTLSITSKISMDSHTDVQARKTVFQQPLCINSSVSHYTEIILPKTLVKAPTFLIE